MTRPTDAQLSCYTADPDPEVGEMARELIEARKRLVLADDWLKEHDNEWCCCTCGPSKTSRAEWCDRGCGSDYNAMVRIDRWRHGRLFRIAARAGGVNG